MFAPFDTIAGSSLGGVSAREMAADIIRAWPDDAPRPQSDLWESLACDADEDIDLDWYSNQLAEALSDNDLPPFCDLLWEDNELRVVPCVESARESLAVYDAGDEHVTESEWLEVTDHGNVTFYRREPDGSAREIWSVV